jgi:hypothetical protein
LRRARAITLGYYLPKPPAPNKAYIEVPKTLKPQIRDMVRGKILKSIREEQSGAPDHSTRLATLAAHKANITSKDEFRADALIVKRQNAANHGSLKLKRTPWADYSNDDEDTENNQNISNILATTLDKWWSEKIQGTQTTTTAALITKTAASQTVTNVGTDEGTNNNNVGTDEGTNNNNAGTNKSTNNNNT